ncbi:phosphoribosylaminoimidazolesuccinocarboxamide synthase [candidate division WOR-3 bacterium]|nr:phosphoribosylaminoimidazolesuccinocarboxamide synthase [candidate division WOR-3 bacterium]
MAVITETNLKSVSLLTRGKVRDIYELGKDKLLIVTTDRISAYDSVMNEGIPGKGETLNSLSLFWKNKFVDLIPNDVIESDVDSMDFILPEEKEICRHRSVLVKKLEVLPFEFIVRGYLCGSAWQMYKSKGKIVDVVPPIGLLLASKFPIPVFTPTTKAKEGHDKPVSWDELSESLGEYTSAQLKEVAIKLYKSASDSAADKGIIIADTKFEFACDKSGSIYLVDEVLTPDSSRFWAAESVLPGVNPPSLDKQLLRDWLDAQNWNRTPPSPAIPEDLIEKISLTYKDIFTRLSN